MTVPALVLALLVSGAADDLVEVSHPPLRLKVPAAWKVIENEGSQRYSAPSGDAYFLLDVGSTARPMSGKECRDKILANMKVAEDDAELLTIGKQPAAKQMAVDKAEGSDEAVQTLTFIGCDGKTTWSLVFHIAGKKSGRYAPLAEKIAKSIVYL